MSKTRKISPDICELMNACTYLQEINEVINFGRIKMKEKTKITQRILMIGVLCAAFIFIGSVTDVAAQYRDNHRSRGIFGTIFGGNNNRDRHHRRDDRRIQRRNNGYYGNGGYYDNDGYYRNNGNYNNRQDRHRRRDH